MHERPRSLWCWVNTCSISGWVGASHSGQGFEPWPWWAMMSLVRFCKPLKCFVPWWQAPARNFGQLPPAVTTWPIKGTFRAHISNFWSLSIFLIVFFMWVGSVESVSVRNSVVKTVLKLDPSSLHSLTKHWDSGSSDNDFMASTPILLESIESEVNYLRKKMWASFYYGCSKT